MRTSALLLAAAAIPAASQATVVINGTWSNDINSVLSQPAVTITVASGSWTINSIALDGVTTVTGAYTPNVGDFWLTLKQGGTTIGTVDTTSVGSLTSIGNGYRSYFMVLSTGITGWDLTAGTYQVYVGTSVSGLTTRGPFGGTGTNGFSYNGPLALTLDVTGSGGSGGAVPEPSTYGIALGGLALVGAVIRRRRSK